jgi:very-short-patch-repair endonuclease
MTRVRRTPRELIDASRELRQRQTPAEALLWTVLRKRDVLGCRARRQHAIGPYVLDFWIPSAKLAIEVDGPIHDEPHIAAQDRERTAWLEAQGIKVLRFSNADVQYELDNVVLRIQRALNQRAKLFPANSHLSE